jgi:H+/Cl- antiporter ClcA
VKRLFNPREHLSALRQLLAWVILVLPVGALAGSASALFLWGLDRVTEIRWHNHWLLFLLPLAGVVIVTLYQRFGGNSAAGNNLIIEQIHNAGGGVPRRMAPFVLVSTLLTHLFGGSAGREGTAVQMGGSLASAYGRVCRFGDQTMRVLLMAGVAAGFGSVFGTPLAGAIFAMEVLVIGRMRYDALIPVLLASVVGDFTCRAWGIGHAHYSVALDDAASGPLAFDGYTLGKVILAGVAFGLASRFFSELTHLIQRVLAKWIRPFWLRPVVGGVVVIALVYLLGTRDYLGLSVSTPDGAGVSLANAFRADGATPWSWWWKIIFTAVTVGSGFKGGEVTPLFFIGATLGNTLAWLTHSPVDLFAALGFVAVFAGAANTPIACAVMGIELFGAHYAVYFAFVCFISYFFSGQSGIYLAQRIGISKTGKIMPEPSLQQFRDEPPR